MSVLTIKDLKADVLLDKPEKNGDGEAKKRILNGVNLQVKPGEIHAIMGPNGSGKSTLAYTLAGNPRYEAVSGSVDLDGEDVLSMKPNERARAGMFLAMQYSTEIPGVTLSNFLRTAKSAVSEEKISVSKWVKRVNSSMKDLKMNKDFLTRSLNEGFSGGEKKRNEILQMELLDPKIAILDEIDSGLDVDALKLVSEGIMRAHDKNNTGIIIVTHYNRILKFVKPDFVHVFSKGKIVKSGDAGLADELEREGYEKYVE